MHGTMHGQRQKKIWDNLSLHNFDKTFVIWLTTNVALMECVVLTNNYSRLANKPTFKKNDRLIICKQILLLHIRWAIARKYIVKIIFTLLDYFQTILLIKISHDSAILENMSILYMKKIVLGLPVLTE